MSELKVHTPEYATRGYVTWVFLCLLATGLYSDYRTSKTIKENSQIYQREIATQQAQISALEMKLAQRGIR